MNTPKNQKGFTIIELLVVIAVIGILAAIAVVSYSGVRDRAKTEKLAASALAVKKAAEAYYERNNVYPSTAEHFQASYVTFPSDTELLRTGWSFTPGGALPMLDIKARDNGIMYKYVRTTLPGLGGEQATGACIYHWNFTTDSRSELLYMGNADSSNCNYASHLGAALPQDP